MLHISFGKYSLLSKFLQFWKKVLKNSHIPSKFLCLREKKRNPTEALPATDRKGRTHGSFYWISPRPPRGKILIKMSAGTLIPQVKYWKEQEI